MIMMCLMISGCESLPAGSSYRVTMPEWQVRPLVHPCRVVNSETNLTHDRECATVLHEDLRAVVRELKAACLAVGGAELQCRTHTP